jgi:hypothetical protein
MTDTESERLLDFLIRAVDALSAPADQQKEVLEGAVVTDELVLDYGDAFSLIPALRHEGVELDPEADRLARRLDELLSAPPSSPFWSDVALDNDPAWDEVRATARALRPLLPAPR